MQGGTRALEQPQFSAFNVHFDQVDTDGWRICIHKIVEPRQLCELFGRDFDAFVYNRAQSILTLMFVSRNREFGLTARISQCHREYAGMRSTR